MRKATIPNNGVALNETIEYYNERINPPRQSTPYPSQEGNKKITTHEMATKHNKPQVRVFTISRFVNPAAAGQQKSAPSPIGEGRGEV